MKDLMKIDKYNRSGSKTLQCYITDEELNEVFISTLGQEKNIYTLIVSQLDKEKGFWHEEYAIETFLELREKGFYAFYLRNINVSPALAIPNEPLKVGGPNSDWIKYYIYNGLITIYHGSLFMHKYLEESAFSIVEKYDISDIPGVIYHNKEYLKLFNKLKREIKKRLKHRSKEVYTSGDTYISKYPNMTERFYEQLKNGHITGYNSLNIYSDDES